MTDDLDPDSVRKMREAVDSIPPQHSPTSRKVLEEFKAAVARMERRVRENSNE